MSSNKSLLKKLISLVCAASSIGLSASAAESAQSATESVQDGDEPVQNGDEPVQNGDEPVGDAAMLPEGKAGYGEKKNDNYECMSSMWDFTYSKGAWRKRVTEDRDKRVSDALPLDGLSGCAEELGGKFRELVTGLADKCYEIRGSYGLWSAGYVDNVGLGSLLNSSSGLWGAISSVCSEVDVITSSGVRYSALRASLRSLSRTLPNIIQALNDMEFGCGEFLDFVRSNLLGYLRACDAILSKRRIRSSLESDFSEQLDSVVVGSVALELGSEDGD